MPCNDTTSKAVVVLDSREHLMKFDFSKMTCGGKIGGGTGFGEFCLGQSIDSILKIEYEDIAQRICLEEENERFLLYLEWSALQSALAQYKGLEEGDRYKVATIDYQTDRVEIRLIVRPPTEMPRRFPSCAARAPTTQDSLG